MRFALTHSQLDFTSQWPLDASGSALGVSAAACPALPRPGARGQLPEAWGQAGGSTRRREGIRATSWHGALSPCASVTLLEIIARDGEPRKASAPSWAQEREQVSLPDCLCFLKHTNGQTPCVLVFTAYRQRYTGLFLRLFQDRVPRGAADV